MRHCSMGFSVCLGRIPGIPGQLRTALLTLCLYSEGKKKCYRARWDTKNPVTRNAIWVKINTRNGRVLWNFMKYRLKESITDSFIFLTCLTFIIILSLFSFLLCLPLLFVPYKCLCLKWCFTNAKNRSRNGPVGGEVNLLCWLWEVLVSTDAEFQSALKENGVLLRLTLGD